MRVKPHNLSLKKFLQSPQSLKPYAYVRNNPLRLVDPDGRAWEDKVNEMGSAVRQKFDDLRAHTSETINTVTTSSMEAYSSVGSGLSEIGESFRGFLNEAHDSFALDGASFLSSDSFRQGFLGVRGMVSAITTQTTGVLMMAAGATAVANAPLIGGATVVGGFALFVKGSLDFGFSTGNFAGGISGNLQPMPNSSMSNLLRSLTKGKSESLRQQSEIMANMFDLAIGGGIPGKIGEIMRSIDVAESLIYGQ